MKSLPPSEHFIPSKYLPNYSQSPYGLCYLVTLFNQLSVALAKQKDCNIQLSFWKFVDCFDKYITSKNSDNPISGEKFTTGKKFNLKLKLIVDDMDTNTEYTFLNLVATSPKDLASSLILLPILDTQQTTMNLGYAYALNDDLQKSSQIIELLTEQRFLDYKEFTIFIGGQASIATEGEGIRPNYRHKWSKVSVTAYDIENIDVSLDEIIEQYRFFEYIELIKNNKKDNHDYDYNTAKFIEILLQNSKIPFKIICSSFDGDREARNNQTFNATQSDCFQSDSCTVNIQLNYKQKDIGGFRDMVGLSSDGIITQIRSIDTLKIVLNDNKAVIWRSRAFITNLLIAIEDLFQIIETYISQNTFSNKNIALSYALQQQKENYKNYIKECPDREKWIDLRINCLDIIFRNNTLKDTNNYGVIDISDIKYFYDSTIPELEMHCIDQKGENIEIFINGNIGHALTVYGYKELSNDKTELYIKNSWRVNNNNDILSDKFRIIVNNDLILDDGRHNGRFGSLSFIKDKYIDFGDVSDDICDCCSDLSSSSSSNNLTSSSSSAGDGSSSSSSIIQSVYACGFGSTTANGQYIYDNSSYNDNPVYINGNSTLYKALPIDTWAISLSGGTSGTVAYFSLNPYSVIDNNWLWSGDDGIEPVGVTQGDPCS